MEVLEYRFDWVRKERTENESNKVGFKILKLNQPLQ